MEQSRRSFLKSGGVAALLTATGLAGCTGDANPLGGGGGGGGGNYAGWLYDPTAVLEDADYQGFATMSIADVYGNMDQFPDDVQEGLETFNDELEDVDLEEMDDMTGIGYGYPTQAGGGTRGGATAVFSGSFDADDIEDAIDQANEEAGSEENQLEEEDDYEGYSVYTQESSYQPYGSDETVVNSLAVAFDSKYVVVGGMTAGEEQSTALDAVETMIDRNNGDADKWTSENDDAKELVNNIGDTTVAAGAIWDQDLADLARGSAEDEVTEVLEDLVGAGQASKLKGESVETKVVLVYDDADAADKETVQEFVDYSRDESDAADELEEPNVSKKGRSIVIKTSAEIETLWENANTGMGVGGGGGGDGTTEYVEGSEAPQAQFQFSASGSGSGKTVSVTHAAGETIQTENLVVSAESLVVIAQGETYGRLSVTENDWSDGTVTAGDTLTFEGSSDDLPEGTVVRVVWRSETSSSVLAEYEIPF
jgi:hypothetical protein